MIETENARERGSGVAVMDEKKTGMGLLRDAVRLLCAVPGNAGCGVAYALGNDCGDHESCSECVGASLATIADRIEREREELDKRLMPLGMEWPRFDDGELVCFGDSVPIYRRSGEVSESEVCSMTFRSRQTDIGTCADFRICLNGGERIKRPKPQVLAADGLPIEVGQTVYSIHDGKRATVKSLFGNIGLQMEADDGDCFETAPLNLTHERPVLGADGLSIKVGETVYFLKNGKEYTVLKFIADDDGYYVDLSGKPFDALLRPSMLTHTPPDTQERIDDDATMPPRAYYAKHIGHDVGLKDDAECTEAMVRHLLNRQREIDGRTMGGE